MTNHDKNLRIADVGTEYCERRWQFSAEPQKLTAKSQWQGVPVEFTLNAEHDFVTAWILMWTATATTLGFIPV